jgi:nuclear receptor co-repressor 1
LIFEVTIHLLFSELPAGLKKCCTACFARISRRITQLTGGSNSPAEVSRPGSEADAVAAAAASSFSDEEVDLMRVALRNAGKNWNAVAEKLQDKAPEQCKKFFYANRKKYGLDKMVVEYKRVRARKNNNRIFIFSLVMQLCSCWHYLYPCKQ